MLRVAVRAPSIGHAGFDPVYGARPLRRYLKCEVEPASAGRRFTGDVHDGATVRVNFSDGQLTTSITNPTGAGHKPPDRPR